MGARSTYHVIVIHQIHLPRITLNRAHERLCSLHPLIDRRLAQSLHLRCLKSPLNAPDLQQWVWCKPGELRLRHFSHIVVFTNHNSNHQIFTSAIDCRWQPLWSLTNGEVQSLFENSQCVKPITFSQVSVLPKPTLLSCHLGRPGSRSKACVSCSSHFDPFYGQKVPKMAINAVFWP